MKIYFYYIVINASGQKIERDLPQKCIRSVSLALDLNQYTFKKQYFFSNALQRFINGVTLVNNYYFIHHDT